jgi:hypothetical protein
MQAAHLVGLELAGRAERVDLCAPEGLVSVDVSEPRNGALVEQRRFHRRPPSSKASGEPGCSKRASERLVPDSFSEVGLEFLGLDEKPGPEPAHVAVDDVRVVV